MEETFNDLVGKKIKDIKVDGFGIFLLLEDGTEFIYDASDGGYSTWEIKDSTKSAELTSISEMEYKI